MANPTEAARSYGFHHDLRFEDCRERCADALDRALLSGDPDIMVGFLNTWGEALRDRLKGGDL